jgi:hypothetical protein
MEKLLIGLLFAMFANILLGASVASLTSNFSKEKLLNGIFKGVCISIALILMYYCSALNPNILVLNINGTNVNMIDGIKLIFTAGIMLYGAKDLIKLKELLGVEINTSDVTETTEGIGTTEPTEGIDNAKKEGE